MEDCRFEGTDRAIRIKSKRGRGGVVENIYARNLQVKDMKREVAILNMDYSSDRQAVSNEQPPVFRNMQFENITAQGAPTAILIQGLEDSPIENIRFVNLKLTTLLGVTVNYATGLEFDNAQITREVGPVFDLKHCSEVTITRSRASKGTGVFLNLEGDSSRAVRLTACDLSEARTKFNTGEGVPKDAVVIK
jgi:polygalacturonase